jgi:hypothetical protein
VSSVTGADELIAKVDSFDWANWRDEFAAEFTPLYEAAICASADADRAMAPKRRGRVRKADDDEDLMFDVDDPFLQHFMTEYVGERIKQLEATTKDDVIRIIRRTFDEGPDRSINELRKLVLETVREKFESYQEYRAQRIARTETGISFNHGTGLLAKQNDLNVQVIDGDDDEECAAANGEVWSADKFLANPLEHPNCTRDGAPTEAEEDDDA